MLPDGRSLVCATIAAGAGAAARWDWYWRRSSMGMCRQYDEYPRSTHRPSMMA